MAVRDRAQPRAPRPPRPRDRAAGPGAARASGARAGPVQRRRRPARGRAAARRPRRAARLAACRPTRGRRAPRRARPRLRRGRSPPSPDTRGGPYPGVPRPRNAALAARKEHLTMYSEIDAILDDLRTAVRRDVHRRRWRTVTAAAMCTLVLCFAGVGIAGSYEDWWSGAQPPANPDQVQQAINENTHGLIQPLSSEKATVATTADASLVAVGTKGGGYCLIPSLTSVPNIGNSCVSSPQSLLYTYATPAGAEQQWILYGRVVDADAASIDLSALGVPQPVRLERGGFFLVDLPQSSWSALDDAHGPITIRDAHGNVVTTGCA